MVRRARWLNVSAFWLISIRLLNSQAVQIEFWLISIRLLNSQAVQIEFTDNMCSLEESNRKWTLAQIEREQIFWTLKLIVWKLINYLNTNIFVNILSTKMNFLSTVQKWIMWTLFRPYVNVQVTPPIVCMPAWSSTLGFAFRSCDVFVLAECGFVGNTVRQ